MTCPLPPGFRRAPSGIELHNPASDSWAPLCGPLEILARTRDGDGLSWGVHVALTDPDGRRHEKLIARHRLYSEPGAAVAELVDAGLCLSPGRRAKEALAELLLTVEPAARLRITRRPGWTDDSRRAFTLGDGRALGAEQVRLQPDGPMQTAAAMTARGDLGDWRREVAARCIGNPLLAAAVSFALSGPLLRPLGIEGGGLHLRGASSRGKSTALRVAAGVWGDPGGLVASWRSTANGLEALATGANDTLLLLDEIAEIEARDASKAAYMIANGQGKARARKSGGLRPAATWRTNLLSSGEISLAEKLREERLRPAAGQELRLLDIPADGFAHGAFDRLHDAADGAGFARALGAACGSAHGTAGPALVEALCADGAAMVEEARRLMARAEARLRGALGPEPDGQVLRALNRFALIAAAGELASALGLTGWPAGEAEDAALELLLLWRDARGGEGATELAAAIGRVRDHLLRHPGRFEPLATAGEVPWKTERDGWSNDEAAWFTDEAWTRIHAPMAGEQAGRLLRDAGVLMQVERDRLQQKLPRAVDGARPRCWRVRRAALEES
ncbi:DUF927 domain-containing protein [Rhodovulum sp. DZ06]|uniref:DUF927 domain-containing protein n=1 Tax=Rhodovulum sp. DZ06 TaxID=3425126 RepID=UPI003D358497